MPNFDPSTIDLTPYRTLPTLTTTGSLALASSLVDRQPANLPDFVKKAAQRLIDAIGEMETALTERLDRKPISGSSARSMSSSIASGSLCEDSSNSGRSMSTTASSC